MINDENVEIIDEGNEFTINNNLIVKNLFGIPIYKTRFKHHSVLKPKWLEYLSDKENFRKNTKDNNLLFTSPNIHKEEIFKPLKEFFEISLKKVMEDNGFVPNIALTGMWATVHPDGGFHHRHHHHNAFWAGVYYLDGSENSSGTTFFSPHYYNIILSPKKIKGVSSKMRNDYTSKFEEGSLIIFPAWLQHATSLNNLKTSKKFRKIISFNSMPVGATNSDPFDRYYFSEPDIDKMISYNSDLLDYKPSMDNKVDELDYFKQQDLPNLSQTTVSDEINTLRSEVDSMKTNLEDIKNLLIKALESK